MHGIAALKNDRNGVSPVIGVILMVAVTVIIAAVIGSTALGLSDSVSETPPQAQFELVEVKNDYEISRASKDYQKRNYGTAIVIGHNGGEDVDVNEITVEVDGEQVYSYGTFDGGQGGGGGHSQVTYPFQEATGDIRQLDGAITAGDQTTLIWYGSFGDDYTIDPQYISDDSETLDYATWRDSGDRFWSDSSSVDPSDGEYSDFESGDTVRIIWESGDQSQTLFEKEI